MDQGFLNEREVKIIEENASLFTEDVILDDLYQIIKCKGYPTNIMIAVAIVCGYSFKIRYYINSTRDLKTDLTATDSKGEWLITFFTMPEDQFMQSRDYGYPTQVIVENQFIQYFGRDKWAKLKKMIFSKLSWDRSKGSYYNS